MPETIEAEQLPLVDIFSDRFEFRIPDYQRPYAWTTEQTAELLEDIAHAASVVMSENGDVQEASPYFLGSVVIIKGNSPKSDVVDGQQRFTTLTILFCVLRDIASPDMARQIHYFVQARTAVFAGVVGNFRLSVRERDEKFFQSHIQEMGVLQNFVERSPENLSDSQQRMLENTKYLWEQVSRLDENQRNTLTSFLVQRCYIVVVSTSDHGSAYRIFSVLNDRGLDLSPTDILKARIIGGMGENVRDRYTEMWENYEDDLGRERYRDLFAHIRMIYVKNKLYRNLQDEFQEHILTDTTHKARKGFMDSVLEPYFEVYKTITEASYESTSGAERVNMFLRHLNRLDNFDWIPPAMAFFKRNLHDTASLIQFTRDLDRLAYGLFIMRANINERIRRYADLLHAIESSATLSDSTGPLQLTDSEKEQILQALDGPIYRKGSRVPLILLRRLDSALADEGASYDHSVISVEHVLPQSPDAGSEWIRNFPDQEERERWTHKLANLVLLSRRKNARAANYDFGRKKDEYFQQNNVTPFVLTTQVVNESEWTPEVLHRRQRDLIEVLKREWRLD